MLGQLLVLTGTMNNLLQTLDELTLLFDSHFEAVKNGSLRATLESFSSTKDENFRRR